VALALASSAGWETAAAGGGTVLFDRTYSCAVPREYAGGSRVLNVSLAPKRTVGDGEWGASGNVSINRDGATSPGLVSFMDGPVGGRADGWLIVSASRCKELKKPLPLAPRGLPGPPTRFEQYLECPATPRVVVRLRARLDRAPQFRRDAGGGRTAAVNFAEVTFAVATEPRRRPIAFGGIDSAGATRLFSVASCTS
jgi:hypothetical protein